MTHKRTPHNNNDNDFSSSDTPTYTHTHTHTDIKAAAGALAGKWQSNVLRMDGKDKRDVESHLQWKAIKG